MRREVGILALLVTLPTSLVGGSPAAAAPAQTKIGKCPYTITAPGAYLVQKNLSCAGTGISIAASNVDLDLGGHTLSGNGTGEGIHVDGQSNVSIHGGTVQGFSGGVVFAHTLGCQLTSVTVRQSNYLGIVGARAIGLTVTGCTATLNNVYGMWFGFECGAISVTHNTANGNGNGGIAFDGTFGSTVSNNTLSNNGCVGLDFFGAPGNTIEGNTLDHNPCLGIALHNGSTGNTVTRNSATGNGGQGIWIEAGSAQNMIQNNTLTGGYAGIEVGGGSFNTIQGNTATLNILGIWLDPGSTSNTIQGNTAQNNRDWDLGDLNPCCDANVWFGNSFKTANQPCVAGFPCKPPPPPPG